MFFGFVLSCFFEISLEEPGFTVPFLGCSACFGLPSRQPVATNSLAHEEAASEAALLAGRRLKQRDLECCSFYRT